jgi:hypothetical protein
MYIEFFFKIAASTILWFIIFYILVGIGNGRYRKSNNLSPLQVSIGILIITGSIMGYMNTLPIDFYEFLHSGSDSVKYMTDFQRELVFKRAENLVLYFSVFLSLFGASVGGNHFYENVLKNKT